MIRMRWRLFRATYCCLFDGLTRMVWSLRCGRVAGGDLLRGGGTFDCAGERKWWVDSYSIVALRGHASKGWFSWMRHPVKERLAPPRGDCMAKLSLMFENKLVKEVSIGSRPVTIGRSPDNDLPSTIWRYQLSRARDFGRAGGGGRSGQLERNVCK